MTSRLTDQTLLARRSKRRSKYCIIDFEVAECFSRKVPSVPLSSALAERALDTSPSTSPASTDAGSDSEAASSVDDSLWRPPPSWSPKIEASRNDFLRRGSWKLCWNNAAQRSTVTMAFSTEKVTFDNSQGDSDCGKNVSSSSGCSSEDSQTAQDSTLQSHSVAESPTSAGHSARSGSSGTGTCSKTGSGTPSRTLSGTPSRTTSGACSATDSGTVSWTESGTVNWTGSTNTNTSNCLSGGPQRYQRANNKAGLAGIADNRRPAMPEATERSLAARIFTDSGTASTSNYSYVTVATHESVCDVKTADSWLIDGNPSLAHPQSHLQHSLPRPALPPPTSPSSESATQDSPVLQKLLPPQLSSAPRGRDHLFLTQTQSATPSSSRPAAHVQRHPTRAALQQNCDLPSSLEQLRQLMDRSSSARRFRYSAANGNENARQSQVLQAPFIHGQTSRSQSMTPPSTATVVGTADDSAADAAVAAASTKVDADSQLEQLRKLLYGDNSPAGCRQSSAGVGVGVCGDGDGDGSWPKFLARGASKSDSPENRRREFKPAKPISGGAQTAVRRFRRSRANVPPLSKPVLKPQSQSQPQPSHSQPFTRRKQQQNREQPQQPDQAKKKQQQLPVKQRQPRLKKLGQQKAPRQPLPRLAVKKPPLASDPTNDVKPIIKKKPPATAGAKRRKVSVLMGSKSATDAAADPALNGNFKRAAAKKLVRFTQPMYM